MALTTLERIIAAAESLISKNGVSRTSLRGIIREAGINLASVHYHFGSKDALLLAVSSKRFEELNQYRTATLNDLEEEYLGKEIPAKKIIATYFGAVFHLSEKFGREYLALIAELHLEFARGSQKEVQAHWESLTRRFAVAYGEASCGISVEEVLWRWAMLSHAFYATLLDRRLMHQFHHGRSEQAAHANLLNRFVEYAHSALNPVNP